MSVIPCLVPYPNTVIRRDGECILSGKCRSIGDGDAATNLNHWLRDLLPGAGPDGLEFIHLTEDTGRTDLGEEGYQLDINPAEVRAIAAGSQGLRHAAQTLRQLIMAYGPRLPALHIRDWPRFGWRGLMLDVSRHFFPVDDVLRFIELAAFHKYSVFHWHLTDDQGWRLEVPGRPELTRTGAWRPETWIGHSSDPSGKFDGRRHGGFYTREEVRKIVARATQLGITVLPEIDLPGHMQAAIAAYPELGHGLVEAKIRTLWGISPHILNCEPATFAFVGEVLEEVVDLFPSHYIHLGGDEVPLDEWQKSPLTKARAQTLQIPVDRLQHHWTCWTSQWLQDRGRSLIGWDEILERSGSELPAGTAVMAWRSEERVVEAARAGYPVVAAPMQPTYLDHYQAEPDSEPLAIGGCNTLEDCASWDPVPATLAHSASADMIMGGQAQLWTEYIPDRKHLEYMAYPRAAFLAEALWTGNDTRSAFPWKERLSGHLANLDKLGVAYRQPV